MIFVLAAVALVFGAITCRLTYLMRPWKDLWSITGGRSRAFFDVIPAWRGNIYDRNGMPLAVSVPVWEIGVDPKLVPIGGRAQFFRVLGEYLQMDVGELEKKIGERLRQNPRLRWISLAENVSENVHAAISKHKLPGVHGRRTFRRIYPQGMSACHVVGFFNAENAGGCGVEKFADFFLRGQDGWVISEKDGRRQELVQYRLRNVPPVDGFDVRLTIDGAIQKMAERELAAIEENFHPQFATIIISEAPTGKLLALACIPNYDPNHFNKAPLEAMRNRAVADIYEPGSVFKIVPVSGGLEDGIVTPKTRIDCSMPTCEFNGKKYSLPKDHSELGELSLVDVLRKSSNRGVAQIAVHSGADRFHAHALAFGFGEKSGYGFDGDSPGLLKPPAQWDGLTITRMPMGHAIGVTPIQMHLAMGVLASEGYLFSPQIIGEILPRGTDGVGMRGIRGQLVIRRQVLNRRTVRQMRTMLVRANDARDPPFLTAYKTGTSQKLANGRYVHDRHIASCSGFFPANNPRYLITIVIDSPLCPGIAWGERYAKPSLFRVARELTGYTQRMFYENLSGEPSSTKTSF
ncbi:MAG: penicillin-binding protein 2 [Puniceicoccales bacterium]|jgi:cell division protein FtsI/penicillin-binding protein 2|nr:penicillin-binding protein 2 [Puniceicoccales bacterium]